MFAKAMITCKLMHSKVYHSGHHLFIKVKKVIFVIKGIGIDIIELNRIEKSIQKNERIVERILTKKERERYEALSNKRRQVEFLAGRFAAKEAFAKAKGTGIGKLSFQHIEIIANEQGAPKIKAKGHSSEKLFVSISHSDTYAIAQVIIAE